MKILTNGYLPINNKRRCVYFTLILFIAFFSSLIGAAGLELVKDINPGATGSNMFNLEAGSQRLFFMADDGSNGMEVWTSSGAIANAVRLTDTSVGTNVATELRYGNKNNIVVNNLYYFSLFSNETREYELWRSDGSVDGTFKLIDLPGYLDDQFKAIGAGGLYYFVPWSDPDYGRELWVSDGTITGTRIVKDINPGSRGSSPHNLISVNDRLYFLVGDNIWTSNGTSGGTQVVTNFEESFYGGIRHMTSVNEMIYLGYLRSPVHELWRYDTNSGQTLLVKHFDALNYDRQDYAAVGDMLYFIAKGAGLDSHDLWKSDGTPGGTVVVKNIAETNAGAYDWSLTNVNGTLFFRANDKEHGWELWKSDGTANGTFMIKDIDEGKDSSRLYCFIAVGDTLFFAEKLDYVTNLWMSDGTEAGTINTDVRVSQLRCPVNFNEQLYFYGGEKTPKEYGLELYRYNLSATTELLTVTTEGKDVTADWSSMPAAKSYTLYYAYADSAGEVDMETLDSIDMGQAKNIFVANLPSGVIFYTAIMAHTSQGDVLSNIVKFRLST